MAEPPAVQNQKQSETLAAVKSPMIFNALSILLVVQMAWIVNGSQITAFDWCALGFIAVVTIWLNVFAAINPRFLAYGPHEYLRESELAHERQMKSIAASRVPPAQNGSSSEDASLPVSSL